MFYCAAENSRPLKHLSSGKLVSDGGFLHMRRTMDCFVLLVCCEGILYIEQDGRRYELKPNQYILLFPGYEHGGYRESAPGLSYYWCHFIMQNNAYQVLNSAEIDRQLFMMRSDPAKCLLNDSYILPEYGTVTAGDRTSLYFRQLLDLANRKCYSAAYTNYALSLLAMEFSQELIEHSTLQTESLKDVNYTLVEIMNWIHVHYNTQLSVQKIAEKYRYNPKYLSGAFKKHTGLSMLKYINQTRLSAAKQLLLNSSLSIKEIAGQAGFNDEKHFMKLFKQMEGLTPTQYKNTFFRVNFSK